MKTVDMALGIFSFCAVAALLAACLSPYVDPRNIWYLAFFGLFFPVIYMANIVLALYWACRWKPLFFLCALALLAGAGYVSTIYKFHSSTKYARGEAGRGRTVSVMSFNVEGFLAIDPSTKRTYSTLAEISAFMREADPDIICIQEYHTTAGFSHEDIALALKEWPYRHVFLTVGQSYGIAVYSKFRILTRQDVSFENSNNGTVAVKVLAHGDTVRVINNHLESTHVDEGNLDFLESPVSEYSSGKKEIAAIGRRLKRSFANRAGQADSVARIIRAEDMPTIVCGDFNDTPVSYAYRTIRGDYGDAFQKKGEGLGYTFKRLYRILRIDYILCSQGMEVLQYESPDVKWSDHNPVIATLKLDAY